MRGRKKDQSVGRPLDADVSYVADCFYERLLHKQTTQRVSKKYKGSMARSWLPSLGVKSTQETVGMVTEGSIRRVAEDCGVVLEEQNSRSHA